MPHYHRTPGLRKIRKMNARQRKKFYVGEYQNLVFSVCGSLMPEYRTAAYFEQFIDDLIDWVYANSMCLVSGGTAENFSIIFDHTQRPPHNITPMQRQMLIEWLVTRKDVQHLRAGKLIDLTVFTAMKPNTINAMKFTNKGRLKTDKRIIDRKSEQ